MSIIYSPNEWIKPEDKKDRTCTIMADLENLSRMVSHTNEGHVEIIRLGSAVTNSVSRYKVVIYVNGEQKDEGECVSNWTESKREAANLTYKGLAPLVRGKWLWWRRHPGFEEEDGKYICSCRIAIVE